VSVHGPPRLYFEPLNLGFYVDPDPVNADPDPASKSIADPCEFGSRSANLVSGIGCVARVKEYVTEDARLLYAALVQVGVFLLKALDDCWEAQADCSTLLTLTVSLVKFNSAYLDPHVVTCLISKLSLFACNTEK
jgi:hypothetical protein